MADTDLNIILRLKDEMSKGMVSAQSSVVKFADGVQKVGQSIESAGRQISRFGGDLSQLGGIVTAGFSAVIIKAADHSSQLRDGIQDLKNAGQSLADTIGNAVAPVFEKVVNSVQNVVRIFNSLNPQLRDQIIQWVAIGGALAVVSGTVLWVGGKLLDLSGNLVQVAGAFMKFVAVHPVLIAIAGATLLIVTYWDQLGGVVMKVINVVEIGVNSIHAGFRIVINKMAEMLNWIVGKMKIVINNLMTMQESMGDSVTGGVLDKMRAGLNNFGKDIEKFTADNQVMISGLTDYTAEMIDGQNGKVADSFENAVNQIRNMAKKLKVEITGLTKATAQEAQTDWKRFQQGIADGWTDAKVKLTDFYSYGKEVAENLSSKFEDTLGETIFDVFKGRSTKDAIKEFGDYCLEIIAKIIAKMLIAKAINMYEGSSNGASALGSGATSAGSSWFGGLFGGGASMGSSGGFTSALDSYGGPGAGILALWAAAFYGTKTHVQDFGKESKDGTLSGFDVLQNKQVYEDLGIADLYDKQEGYFNKITNGVDGFFKGLGLNFELGFTNLTGMVQRFFDPLKLFQGDFDDFVMNSIDTFGVFRATSKAFGVEIDNLSDAFKSLLDPFNLIQRTINETKRVLERLGLSFNNFKDILVMLDPATASIIWLFKTLRDAFGGLSDAIGQAWNWIGNLAGAFVNLDPVLRKIIDLVDDIAGINITGLGGGGGSGGGSWWDPGGFFQTGTRYVPETGYYMLHKGEEVSRANEVANRNSSSGGDININLTIQAVDGASVQRIIPHIVKSLENEINRNGSFRRTLLNV